MWKRWWSCDVSGGDVVRRGSDGVEHSENEDPFVVLVVLTKLVMLVVELEGVKVVYLAWC